MSALRHLAPRLAELEAHGLLRVPQQRLPADLLVLCSNDYLGYAAEPPPSDRGLPGGAGASRLISGDHAAVRALERSLADWLGAETALVFSSGYAANVGAIACLAERADTIVSDACNHASIVDGCRLSGARVMVTDHLDVHAAERAMSAAAARGSGRRWLVTESYFSMNGTSPDLRRLRAICDEHDAALVVDEAHAIGVFGQAGRGLCADASIAPDVLIGTLGKALGLQGAFVTGSHDLRSWLWNRARTLMFSTAVSPWLAQAARLRVKRTAQDDHARRRLQQVVARVRDELAKLDAPILPSHGPILFWHAGSPQRAVGLSERLLERGVLVPAIRPPTVPDGAAGLRISLHARLTDDELRRALGALTELMP